MATTKVSGELVDLRGGLPDYSLAATNTVSYLNAGGGNQYNFNGAYGLYGVVNGTYVLSSVSSSHPIAILNNGKTSLISYTGAVNEGSQTGPDGNTYTYYSGDVTITVSGNFDVVSYACKVHGYMGGQNNLIYTNLHSDLGLKIPSGTELNRPATDVAGMIRNNTNESSGGTASCEEYYNGTAWKILNSNCPADTLDIFGDGSCIAAYTFNNNVNDLSGNYSATPTNVTFTTGLFSEAGSFNGTSSKAVTGGNMSSTFLSACSISVWVNPSSVSSYGYILGNTNTARDRGIGLIITNQGAVNFSAFETGAPGPYFRAATSNNVITTNTWYNIVGTWDGTTGTNSVKVYVNNVSSGQDTPRSSSIESTIAPHLGNSGQGNDEWYSGLIDQLRIFNKELSVSEINTLYNETRC